MHALLHLFCYLEQHHNTHLFFNPTRPKIDEDNFNDGAGWKDFYGDIKEALPPDAPEPHGKSVRLRVMVEK